MNAPLNAQTGRRTTPAVRFWVVWMVVCVATSPLRANPETNNGRLATPDELVQMHDAGQYRICLQQIGRILLARNAGKDYDNFGLLLLRGDCLLHLDDPATAKFAYAAAAKSPIEKQAREARATVFLLQKSDGMTYRPHGEREARDGINVASEQSRIAALRALLNDELRADEVDFQRAERADNLVPIQNALPKLADLYAVELTASGKAARIRPVLEAIGERARTLIERDLDLREQTIAALDRRANEPVDTPAGGWWWGGYARRGLNTYDRRELRGLIDYLQRIEGTTRLGRELATYFDGDSKPWEPLIIRAVKAVSRAQDVLAAE